MHKSSVTAICLPQNSTATVLFPVTLPMTSFPDRLLTLTRSPTFPFSRAVPFPWTTSLLFSARMLTVSPFCTAMALLKELTRHDLACGYLLFRRLAHYLLDARGIVRPHAIEKTLFLIEVREADRVALREVMLRHVELLLYEHPEGHVDVRLHPCSSFDSRPGISRRHWRPAPW